MRTPSAKLMYDISWNGSLRDGSRIPGESRYAVEDEQSEEDRLMRTVRLGAIAMWLEVTPVSADLSFVLSLGGLDATLCSAETQGVCDANNIDTCFRRRT